MKISVLFLFVLFLQMNLLSGCGSDKASTGDDPVNDDLTTSVGFPVDLAISSPTAATAEARKLFSPLEKFIRAVISKEVAPSATDTADMSYEEKVEVFQNILSGTSTSDCNFTLDLNYGTNDASCYGPTIVYELHPDYIEGTSAPGTENGELPPGDFGLWTALDAEKNEACAAAQLNKRMTNISTQIDSMMLTTASMFCIAGVNEIALPEVGASIDLTAEVNAVFDANESGVVVTSAVVARENDSGDDPIYVTTIVGTASGKAIFVRLKHIPTSEDNSTYRGKFSYTISTDSEATLMWCNEVSGMKEAMSIAYEKTAATSLRVELNSGHFCGAGEETDPFVSTTDFTVDATKKVTAPALYLQVPYLTESKAASTYGWGGNYNYALLNLNPSNGAGEFRFAWQAGMPDNATRALNISLEEVSGNLEGEAYYGYGPDAAELALGEINIMYCNWAGPQGAAFVQDKTGKGQLLAQRQLISFDSVNGIFTADSSNIRYAPTLNCDHGGAPFQFGDTLANENAAAFANDLIDISGGIGQTLVVPVNVDEVE